MTKTILIGLFGAAVVAAAPGVAQTAPAPASQKSLQLSKVILDTQAGIKGKIKGGTLCVFPSKWDIAGDKKTQDYERYDTLFSGKIKELGFNAVTVSGDLFAGDDDRNKGDLLVGAVLRPDTINLCSSVNGEKGNMTLAVDWQIYDRATHEVIAKATTTGEGSQEKFARDGLTEMWNRAFVVALTTLIDQGVIQKYAGTGAAGTAMGETAAAGSGATP